MHLGYCLRETDGTEKGTVDAPLVRGPSFVEIRPLHLCYFFYVLVMVNAGLAE